MKTKLLIITLLICSTMFGQYQFTTGDYEFTTSGFTNILTHQSNYSTGKVAIYSSSNTVMMKSEGLPQSNYHIIGAEKNSDGTMYYTLSGGQGITYITVGKKISQDKWTLLFSSDYPLFVIDLHVISASKIR